MQCIATLIGLSPIAAQLRDTFLSFENVLSTFMSGLHGRLSPFGWDSNPLQPFDAVVLVMVHY